jgi:hypothetical protein
MRRRRSKGTATLTAIQRARMMASLGRPDAAMVIVPSGGSTKPPLEGVYRRGVAADARDDRGEEPERRPYERVVPAKAPVVLRAPGIPT